MENTKPPQTSMEAPIFHFTSGEYLHIKTALSSLSFNVHQQSPQEHLDEINEKLRRLNNQANALAQYIAGNTHSHPCALK